MQGTYVLENKKGQVVRVLSWESPLLSVVYLNDSQRVQSVSSVKELEDNDIAYTLLAEVSKEQVQKSPLKLADVGYLKYIPAVKNLSPSVMIPNEDPEAFKKSLKWTSSICALFLLFVFLVSHFTSVPKVEEEQRVVTIITPEKKMILEPVRHKKPIQPPTVAHVKVRSQIKPKIAQIKNVQKVAKHSHVSLNNVGALAILGSLNSGKDAGGLKLSQVNTTRGPGLGGNAGSGGVQTSLYGKGLIAAPLGPNARANGAGGYGNHGAGGGKAGYGKMSLVGSSTAYFEPIQSEAIVEGGLDRAQIAEVIQRHLGQIRNCYEQGLQMEPGLSGRVAIKFFIGGTGYVSSANVSNTSLHSGIVETCIVGHLKSWKFPEPRGGVIVKVNYPFVLKRVSQS